MVGAWRAHNKNDKIVVYNGVGGGCATGVRSMTSRLLASQFKFWCRQLITHFPDTQFHTILKSTVYIWCSHDCKRIFDNLISDTLFITYHSFRQIYLNNLLLLAETLASNEPRSGEYRVSLWPPSSSNQLTWYSISSAHPDVQCETRSIRDEGCLVHNSNNIRHETNRICHFL